MAIDFSYIENAAPQKESTPINSNTVNVTMRVDADSFLHCDGEFVDIQLKAGVITKTKFPVGKHLLEFISLEAPDIKVEKAVDFPEAGKNYLVLISDLSECIEAKRKADAEAKRKAEAEVEAKRKAEEAKRIAEEEARRKAEEAKRIAEEEARRKAEEAKRIAEEEARRKAEEAKRIAEEEAKRKAEEKARARAEARVKRKAEEPKRKAEAEARRKAEEEKLLKGESGTINGHDYVDLGLPSGLKWATCNVGANSPEEYGDYYAWGEVETKSKYTWENCKTYCKWKKDFSGNSTHDVARAKWGSGWHMPTESEFKELLDNCKWEWITLVGKNGYKVTGPNGNCIFLPAAGHRRESGLYFSEKSGFYRSSTPEEYGLDALRLVINASSYKLKAGEREHGLSVRPVSKPKEDCGDTPPESESLLSKLKSIYMAIKI